MPVEYSSHRSTTTTTSSESSPRPPSPDSLRRDTRTPPSRIFTFAPPTGYQLYYAHHPPPQATHYTPWPSVSLPPDLPPAPHRDQYHPPQMYQTQPYQAQQQPQQPQPQQQQHKVWILDCRTCHTFLTNRGMKAVLLLRPHVPLYSTDALPANCSAHGALAPYPSSTTDAEEDEEGRRREVVEEREEAEELPRTCDCLTQTLCCHGCGTAVGYMIVIPCARCTSSSSSSSSAAPSPSYPYAYSPFYPVTPASARATNGHRFVFHSPEVVAHARRYIPGEPGVLPLYSQPQAQSRPARPPRPPPPPSMRPVSLASPSADESMLVLESPDPSPDPDIDLDSPDPSLDSLSFDSPPALVPLTPPLPPQSQSQPQDTTMRAHLHRRGQPPLSGQEIEEGEYHYQQQQQHYADRVAVGVGFGFGGERIVPSYAYGHPATFAAAYAYAHPTPYADRVSPTYTHPHAHVHAHAEPKLTPRTLRAGDALFWHHLARAGEIPGVHDDRRARARGAVAYDR